MITVPRARTRLGAGAVDPVGAISRHQLAELLAATWTSFVDQDCDLEPLASVGDPQPAVVATVDIVGAASARITLTIDPVGAVTATRLMLGEGAYRVPTPADVSDAIGELANILGGNVKGLLPHGATLSLPAVTTGHTSDESVGTDGSIAFTTTVVGWGHHVITASISTRPAGRVGS